MQANHVNGPRSNVRTESRGHALSQCLTLDKAFIPPFKTAGLKDGRKDIKTDGGNRGSELAMGVPASADWKEKYFAKSARIHVGLGLGDAQDS